MPYIDIQLGNYYDTDAKRYVTPPGFVIRTYPTELTWTLAEQTVSEKGKLFRAVALELTGHVTPTTDFHPKKDPAIPGNDIELRHPKTRMTYWAHTTEKPAYEKVTLDLDLENRTMTMHMRMLKAYDDGSGYMVVQHYVKRPWHLWRRWVPDPNGRAFRMKKDAFDVLYKPKGLIFG